MFIIIIVVISLCYGNETIRNEIGLCITKTLFIDKNRHGLLRLLPCTPLAIFYARIITFDTRKYDNFDIIKYRQLQLNSREA